MVRLLFVKKHNKSIYKYIFKIYSYSLHILCTAVVYLNQCCESGSDQRGSGSNFMLDEIKKTKKTLKRVPVKCKSIKIKYISLCLTLDLILGIIK